MTSVAVRERPIIFGAESVRAILDGAKTQTRRVIRKPERLGCVTGHACFGCDCHGIVFEQLCPYGTEGDRLWVREPFLRSPDGAEIEYVAACGTGLHGDLIEAGWQWRPPMFLRRDHARLTLEITEVRVQRLREITEEDAIAEGVVAWREANWERLSDADRLGAAGCPIECFALGWDSINGKRAGCAWADNPWVWAISFSRVSP